MAALLLRGVLTPTKMDDGGFVASLLCLDGVAEQLCQHIDVWHLSMLACTQRVLRHRLSASGDGLLLFAESVKATSSTQLGRSLFLASVSGCADRIHLLFGAGDRIRLVDYRDAASGKSCIWAAAEAGHLSAVRTLADSGAAFKTNQNQPYGRTPLWAASSMGHVHVVQELASRGAHVDAPDRDGQTPIFIASQRGHLQIVQLLAQTGANLNRANWQGVTPICTAAACGGSLQVVEEACGQARGETSTLGDVAFSERHLAVVRELCARGADLNRSDRNKHTPIFMAAACGHEQVVALLIEGKAHVDCRNLQGHTPSFAAAERGHLHVIRELVRAGARIDDADALQRTPLWIAAARGHAAVVRELVRAGGWRLGVIDSAGLTIEDIVAQQLARSADEAEEERYLEIQDLVCEAPAPVSATRQRVGFSS